MINNYMTININNSIDFKESFISLKNTQFNDLSCHSIHSDVCILNKTNLNDLFNEDIDTLNINSLIISNVNILNKIDDISTNMNQYTIISDHLNGLISYYTFDENFNDSTTNNFHLDIYSGSPEISTTQYKFNSSLYLNGNSNLQTSHFTLHYRSFSIALWVYAITTNTNIIEQPKANSQNQTLQILLRNDKSYTLAFWANGLHTPENTFNLNEWHHMVFQVKSNGNREIYYNNTLVASDTNTSLLNVDYNPITIGGGIIGSYFNGYIDDLRFYNRELSTSEINNIYRRNSRYESDNFSINNLNIYDTIIDLCNNLLSNEHLQMEKVDISDEIIFKDDVDVSGNIDVSHVFCDSINQLGGMCILYNNILYYNPTSATTIINPDFCGEETYIDNTIYETSSDKTKIKLLKTGYYKCSYSFVFKHPSNDHQRRGTRVVPVNEYNSSNPYTYGFTYSYMRRYDGINQSSNHNTFLLKNENPNSYIYFNISLSVNNNDVTGNYQNDILYTSLINTYKLTITSGNVIFEYLGS